MKIIRPIITNKLVKTTYSEKTIIKFINEFKKDVFSLTQKQLAKKTYTSEPTISRLIQKLNYDNYKDFVIKINITLSTINRKYLIQKEDNVMSVAKNIINSHAYAAKNGVDAEVISSILDLSKRVVDLKGRIIIYGLGGSNKPLQELTANLQRIGINAFTSQDFHYILPLISSLNKDDIIMLFSNSFSNKEVHFIIAEAKSKKIFTVVVTANGFPPITPSCLIHYKRIHNDDYEVPIASKTAQNVICDIMFQTMLHLKPKLREKLSKTMTIINRWRNV